MTRISLEKAAIQFSEDNAPHPRIYELPPAEGRKLLEEVQKDPVDESGVTISKTTFDTGKWGEVSVRVIRPDDSDASNRPAIYYVHGAGWVFGSSDTHLKLAVELARSTQSIVFVPDYSRSPEAPYPTALEQLYSILEQLDAKDEQNGYDAAKLTIAGDSVGGNMATVLTLLAKEKNGPKIQRQLLFYPVTNAAFDTESYQKFAENYYLTKEGMEWFWDQYTKDPQQRKEIYASPLQATPEQLAGLPEALVITAEADVLRDEGEAYARNLREANVPVTQARFQGMIHDFVMLNVLDQTHATRGAMDLAVSWLNRPFTNQ